MLCDPFFQFDRDPEAVNADRDDCQKEPFDPVAEKLNCFSVESQASALYNGVFDFPVVEHAVSPRQANAERDRRYEAAQKSPADLLKQTAVKIRSCLFAHGFPPKVKICLFMYLTARSRVVTGTSGFLFGKLPFTMYLL